MTKNTIWTEKRMVDKDRNNRGCNYISEKKQELNDKILKMLSTKKSVSKVSITQQKNLKN